LRIRVAIALSLDSPLIVAVFSNDVDFISQKATEDT
jgi:hypothetical protein